MRSPILRFSPTVLALSLCALLRVCAHDSPEHVIENIDKQIESDPTPHLYCLRAKEQRIMRRPGEAEADYRKALALDPDHVDAHLGLSQVLHKTGRLDEALKQVRVAVNKSQPGRSRASSHMVEARILYDEGHFEKSLEASERGFQHFPPGQIDWFLLRGETQQKLGRHQERIAAFKKGWDKNKSYVLRISWIEAMIDAGQFDQALPLVEAEIGRMRFKSSWLLRRARILKGQGKDQQAATDLRVAIQELEPRIHPEKPDAGLLCDRAFAHALLGHAAAAQADLKHARERGAKGFLTEKVEDALKTSAGLAR